MPEFEPLTSEDRQLIGEPEPPPPAPPARTWPWRAGLAAALLLAGFALVVARSQDLSGTADPDPNLTATHALPSHPAERGLRLPHVDSPVRLKLGAADLDLPGDVIAFDVAADGYAAAVATRCTTPSRCWVSLGVSTDGKRWTRRPLRRHVTSEAVTVRSLGGGVLVIEQPRVLRLRSGDGGRTWKRVSLAPMAPVRDADAGTLIVTDGDQPRRVPCAGQVLALLRRDNGRTAPLASQPENINSCAAMAHGNGQDTLWATGIDPVTYQPVVARSGNSGASWRTWPLPEFRGEAERTWLSIAGSEVYVTVFGPIRETPVSYGVLAVFRRTSDGWQRTVRYTDPVTEINAMIACPDGMLLAVQQGQGPFQRPRQLISRDHGLTWALADSTALVTVANPGSPRGHGPRYAWAYTPLGRQGLVRSADCRTWRSLPVR